MQELCITLKKDNCGQTVRDIANPEQTNRKPHREIATLKSKFHKLFTKIHTVKNVEVDIQFNKGAI